MLQNSCDTLPVLNAEAASWFYPTAVSVWEKEEYVMNSVTDASGHPRSFYLENGMSNMYTIPSLNT